MKAILLAIFSFFTAIFKPAFPVTPTLVPTPVVTPAPAPTPTPTPKPLTFSEMNALYGPCVFLPTLMYHHVQSLEAAKTKKQIGLTVTTEKFREQMQYLKGHGYNPVRLQDLVVFFDSGVGIPKKSVLLTFDDAYDDFATDAYPILRDLDFKATVFVPTGLINNSGYLSWDQINQMASENRVSFANHTWSHKNVLATEAVLEGEISTADLQLGEHGLNLTKAFAYPYGLESTRAERYLRQLGYKLAFTTKPGSTLCQKLRFNLPRVRIGETSLSAYGF